VAHRRQRVDDFEILVSNDGLIFDSLGTFNLDIAPGVADIDFSKLLALDEWDVRYVQFNILSNYGDPSHTGLSEVQFHGVPIPEPVTLTLLALGGLALLRRRRRP